MRADFETGKFPEKNCHRKKKESSETERPENSVFFGPDIHIFGYSVFDWLGIQIPKSEPENPIEPGILGSGSGRLSVYPNKPEN